VAQGWRVDGDGDWTVVRYVLSAVFPIDNGAVSGEPWDGVTGRWELASPIYSAVGCGPGTRPAWLVLYAGSVSK
jgi:hypothetical protein